MPSSENKQQVVQHAGNIEDKMYKSSLKQVVAFLNTTLPQVGEADSLEATDKLDKKTKKVRSKQDRDSELQSSYLMRDVTPTRIPAKLEKPEESKKRINKFSGRKYNDIKMSRKLRKGRKELPPKSAESP